MTERSSPDTTEPLDFFSENVDAWGALEWFNRLAKAVRGQDTAVRAGDEMAMETCRNVAASSAMRLVRDYEQQVRAALSPSSAGTEELNKIVEQAEWYVGDKAHAGLAYHLAKHWPQIRAGLNLNAAQPSPVLEAALKAVVAIGSMITDPRNTYGIKMTNIARAALSLPSAHEAAKQALADQAQELDMGYSVASPDRNSQ